MLEAIEIEGYRSLLDLRIDTDPITVITGANGVGKSNLYRALVLTKAAASGRLALTLLEEGGLPSAFWAGDRPRKKRSAQPLRVRIAVAFEDFEYEIAIGLPPRKPPPSPFDVTDPFVKEEYIWLRGPRRPSTTYLERKTASLFVSDADQQRHTYPFELLPGEAAISQIREPHLYPVSAQLRHRIESWRFYHQFRTDFSSPLRTPRPGTRTTALAEDGSDLAPAIQTIFEIGDEERLQRSVADALGGATVGVSFDGFNFAVELAVPSLKRPIKMAEMSDGTLRFLCLAAALLAPRPPPLLVLNEPESSLHPDLLDPLAELIVDASRDAQIWVITHARPLVDALEARAPIETTGLELRDGATRVCGA